MRHALTDHPPPMAIAPHDSLIIALSRPGVGGRDSLHRCAGIGVVLDHLYVDTAAFLVARDFAARGVREGGRPHAAGDPRHLMALFGALIADHYCKLLV
jgi:hypothetical protein